MHTCGSDCVWCLRLPVNSLVAIERIPPALPIQQTFSTDISTDILNVALEAAYASAVPQGPAKLRSDKNASFRISKYTRAFTCRIKIIMRSKTIYIARNHSANTQKGFNLERRQNCQYKHNSVRLYFLLYFLLYYCTMVVLMQVRNIATFHRYPSLWRRSFTRAGIKSV